MIKRRTFIKKLLSFGAIATGLYAWQIEPFWLEFVRIKMPIKNLPDDLVGKTLMQISDIHVGDSVNPKFIRDSFLKAQKFEPDFVVYTGDFVSYKTAKQLKQLTDAFQQVVTGKLGTIGILGNHDYGKKWKEHSVADNIVKILMDKGLTMLRNEQIEVHGLNVIGMDDYWGPNFHPREVMTQLDENKANLVLCHNPDVADEPIWGNYSGWILSGHTHGGQCKPPFLDAPMLPVKNKWFRAGKMDLSGGRTLYINRALGHLLQVRLNVRPEITIFELQKK